MKPITIDGESYGLFPDPLPDEGTTYIKYDVLHCPQDVIAARTHMPVMDTLRWFGKKVGFLVKYQGRQDWRIPDDETTASGGIGLRKMHSGV